jgi:hypothetical protein
MARGELTSWDIYSVRSRKRSFNTDPILFEKNTLSILIKRGKIARNILSTVEEFSWAKRLDEHESKGSNLIDAILENCPPLSIHMWNPLIAMNYAEITNRRERGIFFF